jgi:hypothetical protein
MNYPQEPHSQASFFKQLVLAACAAMAAGSLALGQESTVNERTDYLSTISTIEYSGDQAQACVRMAFLVKTEFAVTEKSADYKKWVRSSMRADTMDEPVGVDYGPINLKRDLTTGELSARERGFDLVLQVANQTIRQLGKEKRTDGSWKQEITLDLGEYYPKALTLHCAVGPIDLEGTAEDTVMIAVGSDPVAYKAAGSESAEDMITAEYRGIFVYSPSGDLLYEAMSSYSATYATETLRVETIQFLTDETGTEPQVPLINDGGFLGLSKKALKVTKEGPLPTWVAQSIRAFDIVDAAAMTTAEKSTNPGGVVRVDVSDTLNNVVTGEMKDPKWHEMQRKLHRFKEVPAPKGPAPVPTQPVRVDLIEAVGNEMIYQEEKLRDVARPIMDWLTKASPLSTVDKILNLARSELYPPPPPPPVRGEPRHLGELFKDWMYGLLGKTADTSKKVWEYSKRQSVKVATKTKELATKDVKVTEKISVKGWHIGAGAATVVAVPILASGGGGGGGGGGDDTSALAGTLSGSWSGTVEGMPVSGSFTMNISANGVVTGSYGGAAGGSISGSVSGSGSLSASGSATGASWMGVIRSSGGVLSGSGSWSTQGGGGSWGG